MIGTSFFNTKTDSSWVATSLRKDGYEISEICSRGVVGVWEGGGGLAAVVVAEKQPGPNSGCYKPAHNTQHTVPCSHGGHTEGRWRNRQELAWIKIQTKNMNIHTSWHLWNNLKEKLKTKTKSYAFTLLIGKFAYKVLFGYTGTFKGFLKTIQG